MDDFKEQDEQGDEQNRCKNHKGGRKSLYVDGIRCVHVTIGLNRLKTGFTAVHQACHMLGKDPAEKGGRGENLDY